MNNLYKTIRVKTPFKAEFLDVFSNEKETRSYLSGQEITGRLDIVGEKAYLVLSDGCGANIDKDYLEVLNN